MAHSNSLGEKPWWYTVLQNLGNESDSDDSDFASIGSDSQPDDNPDDIDIESTDDESETSDSDHSSDDGFIDDADEQT